MSEKIKVAIKVRPLIEREKSEGAQEQWSVDKNSICLTNAKMRDKDYYYFDYVFGQENTNANLFEAVTKPIVDASVRGFNGTIFAYGQTSSGKTYTMMGTELDPGIIPRTISYIFQAIRSITSLEGRNFLLRASYMEIYNEKIIDLLEGKEGLKIREVDGQVVIAKLKEEVACTAEKILNLMRRGEKIRKTSQTNMNERSSRSHTIFRLIIESGLQEEEENGAVQVSHLNLVDLAGSERVDQSGAVGERLKEGCSINTSLFMLARVISQLSEGQEQHVSFRDSKLTRILQSSLGGNAHTAIICTVTPAVIDETISTLGFASRAANIQNKPLRNEVLTDAALLKRYARQIAKLQEELKAKHSSKSSAEIEYKLEETKRHNQLLQQRIDLLQEKLISSTLLDSDTLDKKKALRRRTWGGQATKPRFSVYVPRTLNPIEEEYDCMDQENPQFFSTSDFQCSGFEIPLEEFELELIEAERNRFSTESTSSEDSVVTLRKKCKTVSFVDQNVDCQTITAGSKEDECLPESDYITQFSKKKEEKNSSREVDCQTDDLYSDAVKVAVNTTLEITTDDSCPKQCRKCKTRNADMKDGDSQTESAVCVRPSDQFTTETPPKELRKRIKYYQEEYDELLEFTTLEKQVICKEQLADLLQENEQLRRENCEIKKSVTELETMYLEANRSLSLLKDENKHLKHTLDKEMKQCSELSRSISLLNKTQEKTNGQLKDVLALEKEMKALKLKLCTLENEKCDFEIIQQLQEEKYNKRITELTKSLEEAWKHNDIVNKDEMDRSKCKECRCLKKESEVDPVIKENGITSQKDKSDISLQVMYCAQEQDSEYKNLLAEKEKTLDALCKRLSEAEGKIIELSSTVESHAKCSSVLRERDAALMLLQEQLANKEKLTDCSKINEQTLTLMEEELSKAKNEIVELVEIKDRHAACIAGLTEKEECYVISQKELEVRYSELTMILKEKEEIIMLLQEKLRGTENSLEEVRKLTEDYSTCVEQLKENQETVFILQAQLTNNEIVFKDMNEKLWTLTEELNKKEHKIADLEEKLVKTESEIQNIHIPYVEMLRERDESLSSFKQHIAEREKLLEESESKNLKLAMNLKETEESVVLLQRDLIQTQNQINEAAKIKQLHEECERVTEKNQQTVTELREQLTNSEKSISDVTQKYSDAIDALKKSQDSYTLLQEKLNNVENELKALIELKVKHAALIEQFRLKEDIHVSLKEQLTNYQISLSEMEQNNGLLTNSLKEKENALILLQNKLTKAEHSSKEAAEIKNIHVMCAIALNEKEESLSSCKQKIADNEIFLAETTYKISKLSQASIEKEERIASLEKKLQEAEENCRKNLAINCNKVEKVENKILLNLEVNNVLSEIVEENETNFKCTSAVGQNELAELIQNSTDLTLILKEKEGIVAKLQQKLQKFENYTEDLTAIQKICSLCVETLKEKEELLTVLKSNTLEISLEEMTEKYSNLSRAVRENKQNTEVKKLFNFETELEKNYSTYIETLKENKLESAAVVEKTFCEDEMNEEEIVVMGEKLSTAIKERDEYLSFLQENLAVNKTFVAEIMQKCLALTEALKEKEEAIALLQVKLHKSSLEVEEGKKFQHIHSECILKLKEKEELLLCLEEKLVANEIFTVKATQNCSELVKTFGDLEERMNDLEQKLYKSENNKETARVLSTCMQTLEEKDKSVVGFSESVKENKALQIDLTQKYSNLRETLKEKEETITILQEKLYECRSAMEEKLAANEITAVETTQNCLNLAEVFRSLEERINYLEPKLYEIENKETKRLSVYTEALEEKDKFILTLQGNLITNETLVIDLTQKCSHLKGILKGKEKIIAVLEEKLHDSQSELEEEKEIHSQCIQELRDKDKLLSHLEKKVITNEISAAETIQNCSDLVVALRGIEESINALEQKLSEAENCERETERKMSIYLDALKEKEEIIALLEEKLFESQSKVEGEEIHSQCFQKLKEKDDLLLNLERKITANEICAAETIQNCSKLAVALRAIEEIINALEQKLYEAESCKREMERRLSTYADSLKEKETIVVLLQMKLDESESKVKEVHSICMDSIKQKEDSLVILQEKLVAVESSATEMERSCLTLSTALEEKEQTIAILQEKLHKTERSKKAKTEMNCDGEVFNGCGASKEVFTSELANILKQIEETLNLLAQKVCEIGFDEDTEMHSIITALKKTENTIVLVQKKMIEVHEIVKSCSFIKGLKEKDQGSLLFQEEPREARNKMGGDSELNELCSACTAALKQKETSLAYTQESLTHAEISMEELNKKCSELTEMLKEKEETLAVLQRIVHKTENTLKERCKKCEVLQITPEVMTTEWQQMTEGTENHVEESNSYNSMLAESLEETEEPENLLKAKLSRAGVELMEMKKVVEEHSECATVLMLKEETVMCLKNELASNQKLLVSLEEKYSTLTDVLNNKNLEIEVLKEKCNYMMNEVTMLAALKEAHATCANFIKVKEQLASSLQEELINSGKYLTKVEETLDKISREKEGMKNELENKTMEIENLKEVNKINSEALKQKTEDIISLEEKLSNNEIFIRDLEAANINIANALKNKEVEFATPLNESGLSLGATSPFQSHVLSENGITPVPNNLEWNAIIKERETLRYERNNYQNLYEGEGRRLQEIAHLFQEELNEEQMSSSIVSQSCTHNYPANPANQVQQSLVSEKMLKEIENRKSNNFESETISNDPFLKGCTCSKTELEILRNENAAIMKTCKELEDTVKEYETSLKQLRCKNVNLTSELQDKTQEIYSLTKAMMNEISSLNPKLKPALKEHCLQKLLSTLLSSIMEKQKELHEKMEDHISYLNSKMAEKEKQYADYDKRKDSWIKQLESEVEQLSKQLDDLDSRKVPVKQDNSDVLAKLKEEKQELIKKIQYLEQDVKSFQQQMSAEAETEKLKHKDFISKIDKLESNILCKDKIIMKLEEEIETKNCKEYQLLMKFENAIKQSNTLECKLKAMEGKLSELEEAKLTLLQTLECKCSEEREQRDILNSEYERNKMLTSQIMQLKTHMENISRKNDLLTNEKANWEQNLEEEQQKSSTILSKMEAMEQEMDCLKQESISKDVAYTQEKLALQEEQQKTSTLLLKIEVMEEEIDHLKQVAISKDITIQQEKLTFEKKIQELEYNAEMCKAETIESMRQMDKTIKQLEQEIEIKHYTFENESKKVTELQLNLKVLEEKVNDLDNTNSALSEEVKHKHEMEQKLMHKLSIEMHKMQILTNHLAEVTAQKENIVQRNEELIKRNVQLEAQCDFLQKAKMQVQSLLNIIEKEFKTLKEEVIHRKATMVKVYTVGQPCETRQPAQGGKNSTDLLNHEQQEYILRFQESIREINEYLSQTDTYWEELENMRHENNVLFEEHEACKVALEAEKNKIAQLEKETSKECASSNEEKQASEASKETATRLERTLHQLCKTEKEREHYKKFLKHEQEERRLLTHDLQQLKSKLESYKSKNNVLYTHARDLQVRLEELRDRNQHLEFENNGAAHRIEQLQEEIKELREANAASAEKCQCTTLNKEVTQLRNEASEKAAWEQRCKAERRQCQKFEKDIKLYKEKVSELKTELYKIHDSELKMHHKTKLANVGVQVNELKLLKGTSETPPDVVRENKELGAKIEKYKELCRFRLQKIRNLEHQVQQLEDSCSRLQGQSEMQSSDKMENKENQEDIAVNRPLSKNVIAYSLHSTPLKK